MATLNENMKRDKRLLDVQRKITAVCDFLNPYLALANCHNTDFFVRDLWDQLVDPCIQNQLLDLTDRQLSHLPGWGAALVETETQNVFCSASNEICNTSGTNQNHDVKAPYSQHTSLCWEHKTLEHFVHSAHQVSLLNLDILMPMSSLVSSQESTVISEFMSAKKSHEVDIMSALCSSLCDQHGLKQIIDIGSGRGYLSSNLSLKYKIPVIGLDSSQINTGSALNRQGKLGKQWNGLVKRAELLNLNSEMSESDDQSKNINNACTHNASKCIGSCKCPSFPNHQNTNHTNSSSTSTKSDICCSKTSNTKLAFCREDKCGDSEQRTKHELSQFQPLFMPLTQYITPETDLLEILQSQSYKLSENSSHVLLTGLHTCGSLASSMLQLFVNNSYARVVCNVGCCYQHLEETNGTTDQGRASRSFPMSSFLTSQNFILGRKSRMLASQSVERGTHLSRVVPQSLHWRAVLQVILRDVLGCLSDEWRVGKIAKKSADFCQYVRKAFLKLGIEKKMTDEEITMYEERYADQQRHMTSFSQLRTVLAPCIETLILLDRVCYLLEQENVGEVYISQLFDAIKSPRCYGITAVKNTVGDI